MLFHLNQLKGGDSLLYYALKLYKLTPEIRWTAGGYVWPIDRLVDCDGDFGNETAHPNRMASPRGGAAAAPPVRGMFGIYVDPADGRSADALRWRAEKSGAMTF